MSAGLDLRKRLVRKDPPKKIGKRAEHSPLDAIDAGSPGEVRISSDAMVALNHLYHASPSIQAARTILLGQLLSSGCIVRRGGRDVELHDTFARHLHDVWVPFAKAVIDGFLQFGFCVVSLEEEAPPPFANFIRGRKSMSAQSEMGPAANGRENSRKDAPNASESRARKRPISTDDDSRRTPKKNEITNLVPVVPDFGQCEVSFVYTGASNYRRQYRIFTTNSDSVFAQDFVSEIFFRSPPDAAGNICSPVATVFQSASFISALEELALQAEVVRARQLLVTQPIQRTAGSQNLDPANLFFDSESRAVQASATAEDDAAQAQGLAVQAAMMRKINALQTTNTDSSRAGGSSAVPTHVPPPMPPQLFACPGKRSFLNTITTAPLTIPRVFGADRQQVVPGVRPPEARSDLVDLMRVINDHIAAALGVPASVIFEGKFSSNSMSQLQLLNATIQSIALSVNKVLSATYHACYADAMEGDELVLVTAPLCSTAELQSLFEGGIIDIESALPAALHSLGCTAVEIAGASKRRRQADQDGTDSKTLDAQNQAKLGDADVALKGAQTLKTTAETKVIDQQVAKVKADTKKTLHDALAPHATPGAAAAGGGSAGSSGAGSSGAGSSGAGKSVKK